jgi:hypothetical protein
MEKLRIEDWITKTMKFDVWPSLKQQCIGSRMNGGKKKLNGNMRDVHESSQHNVTPWEHQDIWSQSTPWLAMLVSLLLPLCEFSSEIVNWFSVRGLFMPRGMVQQCQANFLDRGIGPYARNHQKTLKYGMWHSLYWHVKHLNVKECDASALCVPNALHCSVQQNWTSSDVHYRCV